MKITASLLRRQRAYALMMVLIFSGISLLFLGAAMDWTTTSANLNERYNQYVSTQLAAEAATEKVVSAMLKDFDNYGQAGIANNLNSYKSMVPSSSEDSFWSNFEFNNAQGTADKVYVAQNGSAYYTNDLGSTYTGLGGTRIPFRIVSNARQKSGRFAITNAAQQDLAMTTIPIFQFAIFYNDLLEFNRCAPMNIRGRVHSNGDLYVGTLSGSSLTFYEHVSAVGSILKKSWWNVDVSDYSGPVTYNKGYTEAAKTMTLPVGTNNTSEALHKIIELPPAGESPSSTMGLERYYNKAELLILVSNSTVRVGVKTPFSAGSNNIPWSQVSYFVSTNKTFYDDREDTDQIVTEIDVAKFNTWAATNTTVASTLGAGNPPALIYVQDDRGGTQVTTNVVTTTNSYATSTWPGNGVGSITTNISSWKPGNGTYYNSLPSNRYDDRPHPTKYNKYQYRTAEYSYQTVTTTTNVNTVYLGQGVVRLVNGQTLGSRGLTVSSPSPLYVKGHFNCPDSSHLGTTNTTAIKPASLVADAVTILSGSWNDANGALDYKANRDAADTTVNAALVTGNVPSDGSDGDNPMSGGAHNLPRLLEDWYQRTLTINGSLVCIYESQVATANFISPGDSGEYYRPPTRNWSFDPNFLDPAKLPPGTPAVRIMERLKWATPPVNTVTYAGN